jgi:hypothetical protein
MYYVIKLCRFVCGRGVTCINAEFDIVNSCNYNVITLFMAPKTLHTASAGS